MPTPANVAMPATALVVTVPIVLAPELTVMVTAAVLVVTMLPAASLMVMMGWVVNTEPLAEPAAAVLSIARVARPKVGVML